MPIAGPADETAIREQAYYFWEQDGRPEGRETEYWMRATIAISEKWQLDSLTAPAPEKPKGKPKAAASKSKPIPVKAEAAKKPKKK